MNYKVIIGTISGIAIICGASFGYGKNAQKIEGNKESIVEVKEDQKNDDKVNMEQTVALTRLSTVQERVVKLLDKLEKKLK